jgi:hypothetical protein
MGTQKRMASGGQGYKPPGRTRGDHGGQSSNGTGSSRSMSASHINIRPILRNDSFSQIPDLEGNIWRNGGGGIVKTTELFFVYSRLI